MKKIISMILVAAMMLSLALCLFSCGDDTTDGGMVNYTVTVVDENGKPVKDVVITFTSEGGEPAMKFTKSEGTVSFESDKKVSAKITSIPDGYKKGDVNKSISFDKDGKATVTLVKEQSAVTKETYTIVVVDQNGDPVSGVAVQMCTNEGCLGAMITDSQGKATYNQTPDNFKAQLSITIPENATPDEIETIIADTLPEGYTVENPTAKYEFVDGVATIVLTKVN